MSDDHEMLSSDAEDSISTPTNNPTALTSPPGSQHSVHPPTMPTAPSDTSNANGKRPLRDISNSMQGEDEDDDDVIAMSVGGRSANTSASKPKSAEFPPRTHQASGYTWTREEDSPGFSWSNKKAMDEAQRAWDGLAHREAMVKNRYGDPFEMAEKEQVIRNSPQQR
ncbi:hypothetical protein KC363_g1659 [Hortaea werneckii]|uniref:Uncharacterized protein n=1 Tax=Hortaea werneckii TaxID=91943 RepID=A0A3M7G5U7_HORWE|nr:hypothetical protein KC363_g1659 [Hortaea werneckii]RMY96126.1 hypothetical protein D0861_00267 [Hortaea werneckii]